MQKRNTIIGFLLLVIVLAGVYYLFSLKSPTDTEDLKEVLPSSDEVINILERDWESIQRGISFRPRFHNQEEQANGIWRSPTSIQFISYFNLLAQFEDDNNVHVAVINYGGGNFAIKEVFMNQAQFSENEWNGIISLHGSSNYPVETFSKGLVRNGQIITYDKMTPVAENVFLK